MKRLEGCISMVYDLGIIGGGPAGYSAALRGRDYGISVAIFEKESIGGVCLNTGCIPMKSYLHSSKVYRMAKQEGLNPSMPSIEGMKEQSNRNVLRLRDGLTNLLKRAGIDVFQEEVERIEHGECYRFITYNGTYDVRHVIVATGSKAVIPQVQGLEELLLERKAYLGIKFIEMDDIPQRIVILGCGALGLEIASFLSDIGRQVMLIDKQEKILSFLDEDVRKFYIGELRQRGIKFLLGANVIELELEDDKVSIVYEQMDSIEETSCDLLIVAAGRRPYNPFTTLDGIHVCGDAAGGDMTAHAAIVAGEDAVDEIFSGRGRLTEEMELPHVIYSSPELACIGRGENQLPTEGVTTIVKTMSHSGRYLIESGRVNGILKTIKRGEQLVGCQMVGDGSVELISFALDNSKRIFPHPSIAEILKKGVGI